MSWSPPKDGYQFFVAYNSTPEDIEIATTTSTSVNVEYLDVDTKYSAHVIALPNDENQKWYYCVKNVITSKSKNITFGLGFYVHSTTLRFVCLPVFLSVRLSICSQVDIYRVFFCLISFYFSIFLSSISVSLVSLRQSFNIMESNLCRKDQTHVVPELPIHFKPL